MTENTLSLRDHAVAHARNGFRVFKLIVGGKIPAVEKFPEIASNDPKRVHDMWTDPVSGDSLHNNIGILTGGDFFVLDVDVKDGKKGLDSLDLLLELGLSTETRTALSPTGSYHYYFAIPDNTGGIRNTAGKLGNGLDTRGHHGFVVAPGSIAPNLYGEPEEYVWQDESEMAEAPQWLVDRIRTIIPRNIVGTAAVELDLESNIVRAIDWLAGPAPEAIEGSGGNTRTYEIAAKVKDFGVSEHECAALMLTHWNEEKAHPPWMPEELERIVSNAYRYGQEAAGRSSAHADFTVVELQQAETKEDKLAWIKADPIEDIDFANIPRRRWLVQDYLARTFISALVSPGGMGKTQLIVNTLIGVTGNNADIIGLPIVEPTNAWYWNQEDDLGELQRRFAAARQHHGVPHEAIRGKVFLNSGVDTPLILVKRKDRLLYQDKELIERIIATIKAHDIGLFVVDPLVEFHDANENDNVEMRLVMAALRRIATVANCSVLIAAHTRKPPAASSDGFAGDADTMRGAGSQVNAARVVHTLFNMSQKDAKMYGIPADKRHLYVRLDAGKANLSLVDGKAKWLRRVTVELPNGEKVGALEPVQMTVRSADADIAHDIAAAIDGLERSRWYGVADFFDLLNEQAQALLGPVRANWSRPLRKAFKEIDIALDETVPRDVATDFGTLTVVNKKGRTGLQFRLADDDARQVENLDEQTSSG